MSGSPRHRPRGAPAVAFAATVAILACCRVAIAGDGIAEVTTVTPGRCLDEAELVRRAGDWLPADDIGPGLTVEVTESDAGVLLVLRREGAVLGARALELAGQPCEEVREAAALALASALDRRPPPAPAVEPAPASPPPAPPPTPPPLPPLAWPIPPPTAPSARSEDDDRPHVGVAVEAGVLVGLVPAVAAGFTSAIELQLTRWLDLRAAALISTTPTVDLEEDGVRTGTADVTLLAGRLDGCLAHRLAEPARVRGCGGFLLGAVVAEGVDVPNPRSGASPWLAASLRGDARWELGLGLQLGLAVEGFAALARQELVASGVAGRATFAPAGVAVLAGPAYRF